MAIWTERQRQLIADAEDACEREDAADNKPNDIRDRVLARLQAVTDDQIDALIARALEGPPSYLRLVLQLAGVSLKEREVRTPVKGANLIIIEPTQEELDEYAATHQPTPAPAEHPTPTTQHPDAAPSRQAPSISVRAAAEPHGASGRDARGPRGEVAAASHGEAAPSAPPTHPLSGAGTRDQWPWRPRGRPKSASVWS
jgi:hypothetical protein